MTNKSSGQPAFLDGTLSTQREGKDVLGRVHVAVVASATSGTNPLSYSKSAHTFRTTVGYDSAARANLSRESLINVHERGSVPAGFVPELGLEHCPTGVIDGLGHPRFDESGRTYIADRDQSVVFSQTGRGLTQIKMTRPLALRRARFVAGLDILLKSVTVIPHLVDSVGVRC